MRVETSFDLVGDLIGVDAVVVGPTGRAEVQLILDAGAVMTSVADSIGYSSALRVGWTVTRTAAAEERGYIVRSEVSTLGFSRHGLPVPPQPRDPTRRTANLRREDLNLLAAVQRRHHMLGGALRRASVRGPRSRARWIRGARDTIVDA